MTSILLQSRKIALIANLASNNSRNQSRFDHFAYEHLSKNGLEVSLYQTDSLTELEKAVSESLHKGTREFITIGGDGSLHHLVHQLYIQSPDISQIKLAVLPKGTGNDYIRNFNFKSKREILDAIINENYRPIDIGILSYEDKKKPFINMLGIGFSASVVKNLGFYKWLGGLSYYIALVSTFFKYRSAKIEVEIDEQKLNSDCFQLCIGIGKYAGNNMKLCPNASIDDGLFDVNIIEKVSLWKLLRYMHTLKDGSYLKHIPSRSYVAKCIKVKNYDQLNCEADGEELACPSEIYIKEKSIQLPFSLK